MEMSRTKVKSQQECAITNYSGGGVSDQQRDRYRYRQKEF